MSGEKTIRVGGASGFWGESDMALPQFLAEGTLDYIVFDYLAEITLSIMARARANDKSKGYATDFVSSVLKPNLSEIARQRVKIISNAGGMNPRACAAAIEAIIREAGLDLKVATITGDDLVERADEFKIKGYSDMFSDSPFPDPDQVASVNAYLGAPPIAEALREGADIIITGRGVDSAVTLGACLHAFDWQMDDWDKLAAGSLAGHIIECGPQATGGNFTDWLSVAETLDKVGYPIAVIASDGTCEITKPTSTGGKVTPATVGEQMLYEIGDPQAYMLPDVICDFSQVELTHSGPDRVAISGAKGRPPPPDLKVSVTYSDGWRAGTSFFFIGQDASAKAEVFANLTFRRARKKLQSLKATDFTETSVEIVGDQSAYGEYERDRSARDVALKIAVKHKDQNAAALILKESIGLALATPPGLTMFAGSRPKPSPVVRLFSFLLPRSEVTPIVHVNGATFPVTMRDCHATPAPIRVAPPETTGPHAKCVPLSKLAWTRSGDKGNIANIGVLPREPKFAPWIWAALDEDTVKTLFSHYVEGKVERFFMPGTSAINIVLHQALGGGGIASLRNDPQGKTYGQILLTANIPVSAEIAEQLS